VAALARQDPYVQHKLVSEFSVREWNVVVRSPGVTLK